MRHIALVLRANVLDEILSHHERHPFRYLPGLRIHHGILDRDVELKFAELRPRITLNNVKLIRRRVPGEVEPGLPVKAHRIHHEFVTLPFGDRVAKPRRLEVRWVRSAVQVNLPIAMHTALEEYYDQA